MGYCSHVALCLSSAAEAALQKKYRAALCDPESDLPPDAENLLDPPDRHYEQQGASLRIWEAVKWYKEEFPELGFLHNFLNDLSYDDWLFLRYGEELDHIERDGGYFDNPFNIRIARSFTLGSVPSIPRPFFKDDENDESAPA